MGFFVYSGPSAHFSYWASVMRKIDPILYERMTTLVSGMGYELVGCEVLSQPGSMLFRIYIDSEKGVKVDDCSRVSRQIGAMMDVDGPFQGKYHLEVSSPGIDRPLFEPAHFRKYVGKRIKVRLYTPVNQQRKYNGMLKQVEGEEITILVDTSEQEVKLSFSNIEKANLIGDIDFQRAEDR